MFLLQYDVAWESSTVMILSLYDMSLKMKSVSLQCDMLLGWQNVFKTV